MTSEAKWIIEEHPGCLRPSSRHSYDHPPSKVAMSSHAKCKSDLYFYSVYCIHLLNENIDLAFGLPNVLFLLFFFIPPDPHHVLVITLGVTLPKSQSQMTILLFSDKTSYLQNGCTLSDSVNSFSMRTGALGQRMTLCAIGSQGKSCTTITISKVRSRSCTHIACSHICCHRNAKECAETAGHSIMSDMSHMWGLRPNQMVVGSLHTYKCTHMPLPADSKESVLETIL